MHPNHDRTPSKGYGLARDRRNLGRLGVSPDRLLDDSFVATVAFVARRRRETTRTRPRGTPTRRRRTLR
jgi:hypothetical protein